jgi:hypothetical protein
MIYIVPLKKLRKILGLKQKNKKTKKLLQYDVAQYDWVFQKLNLFNFQLYCATSSYNFFYFFFF